METALATVAAANTLYPYIAAAQPVVSSAAGSLAGYAAYNLGRLTKYGLKRGFLNLKNRWNKPSTTTNMPRGSYKRKRGRSMPPTVRSLKRRRVVKRKRTKSLARYAKRKSKYRSKLRGLVGPQCLPKTCFCVLKYKVCGVWNPATLAQNFVTYEFYKCSLSGAAGVRPTPWATTSGIPILAVNSTTPRILDFLGDMFDRYRVSFVKHNIKWTRAPTNGLGATHALVMSIGPADYDEIAGTTTLAAPATPQDLLMDNQQDTKVYARSWENQSTNAPAGVMPEIRRFKLRKKVPALLGVPPKEYWTEDEYAGSIQGDIGARVWAAPVKSTNLGVTLMKLDNSNLPAATTEHTYYIGTISMGVYFDAWNQVYRTSDV